MLTFKDVTKDEHLVSPKQPKYRRGKHPNSLKNLLGPRWEKGQSGNPYGYSVTARVKHLLTQQSDFIPPHANPKDKVYRDQIARTIVKEAACGNVPMVRELLDRTEGKVPDNSGGIRDVNVVFVIGKGYQTDEPLG